MSRRLAVFDIDGTLTATNEVDDECFLRAVTHALGTGPLDNIEWRDAPHVTDTALVSWICVRHLGREVQPGELAMTRNSFLTHLAEELALRPIRFAAIVGAQQALRHIRTHGWEVAFATGGWLPSATMKLRNAGLWSNDLVIASSTDAVTRGEIVQLAIERASRRRQGAFSRVVLVGDAVWDADTAAILSLPFVGVATARQAQPLREHGVSAILPDLSDAAALETMLEKATAPLGARSLSH